MLARLKALIFRSTLEELRREWSIAATEGQIEAYRLGKAHGEIQGYNQAVAQMQDLVSAKRYPEMTEGDVEKLARLVH